MIIYFAGSLTFEREKQLEKLIHRRLFSYYYVLIENQVFEYFKERVCNEN